MKGRVIVKDKKAIITVISAIIVIILAIMAFGAYHHSSSKTDKTATSSSSIATSTSSSNSSSSSMSSSSSQKTVKKDTKKQTAQDINPNPVYKPITSNYYGNWYYGQEAKIVVQPDLFRGDHPTDPVSGQGPLMMERYGKTDAVYIESLYKINTYWPAVLKVNGDESYNVMVTSNANQFNDFKIYTSVPTKNPIKEYTFKQSHPELVDKHYISTAELDSLK